MPSITWDTFTWQVFATLCAVAGAVYVGLKQVSIARSQAKTAEAAVEVARIQAGTARLAQKTSSLAQRTSLFEKRYEIYLAVKEYLVASLDVTSSQLYEERYRQVAVKLTKARFFFAKSVVDNINEVLELSEDYYVFQNQLTLFPEDDIAVNKRKAEAIQKRAEIRSAITDLAAHMGDEMRLYPDEDVTASPIADKNPPGPRGN